MGTQLREWLSERIERYLSNQTDVEEFWAPVAEFVGQHLDSPDDPNDRAVYCARRITNLAMQVIRWGFPEQEPVLCEFLSQWLVALRLSDVDWANVVGETSRPLEFLDDGTWDAVRSVGS
jgi:hypothetical protein